jgi:hypothetical protein
MVGDAQNNSISLSLKFLYLSEEEWIPLLTAALNHV